MSQQGRPFLHQDASANSLGLARILVFGIWFYELAVDPIQHLAELPASAFSPPGILRLLPDQLWNLLLSSSFLFTLKGGILIGLALVILGLTHSKIILGLIVGALVIYQGILRGFSGHMNHAELALLYISALFVFFPVFDGLALRRPRAITGQKDPDETTARDRAPYVTAMIAACALLSLTYCFVGAVRIWKGIGLFGTPALRDHVANLAIQGGQFDGNTIIPVDVAAAVLGLPLGLFQFFFVITTLFELMAPLAIFGRLLRFVIVSGLVLFHVSAWAFMNIPFWENMCLLVLFSGTWFHQVAAWLGRLTERSQAVKTA